MICMTLFQQNDSNCENDINEYDNKNDNKEDENYTINHIGEQYSIVIGKGIILYLYYYKKLCISFVLCFFNHLFRFGTFLS